MSYYSQCEEDQYLNTHFFKNKRNGFYIELGAIDGLMFSNTKFYEDTLGWSGILIEPHTFAFKCLQQQRPNNFLFNELVSCHTEPLDYRYFDDGFIAVSGVENTLSSVQLEHFFNNKDDPAIQLFNQYIETIKPISLTNIVKQTNISHFDFLSLDVEGHEYEVLLSWDFSIPIDLILIEMHEVNEEKNKLCRQLLIQNEYIYIETYKHNEIYVHNTYQLHS